MTLPPAIATSSLNALEDWSNDPDFDFPSVPSAPALRPYSPAPADYNDGGYAREDDEEGFGSDNDGFGEVERVPAKSGEMRGKGVERRESRSHVGTVGTMNKLSRKSPKAILQAVGDVRTGNDDMEDGFDITDTEHPLPSSSRRIPQPDFRSASSNSHSNPAQGSNPISSAKKTGPHLITKSSFANLKLNKFQQARLNTRPDGFGETSQGQGTIRGGVAGNEVEDWDDGFGVDEHDEKEETIRPGQAGFGRRQTAEGSGGGTIKLGGHGLKLAMQDHGDEDDDLDFDFPADEPGTNTLPLTFSHLKLVNRQSSNTPHHRYHIKGQTTSGFGQEAALRHRSSRSSLLSTNTNPTSSSTSDWDSPTHQANVRVSNQHGHGHGHGSRSYRVATPSTTATSLTPSVSLGGGTTDSSFGGESIQTPKHGDGIRPLLTPGSSSDSLDVTDADDFEDGLEIPSGKLSFFSSGRVGVGELNRLLDKKRKSGCVPGPNTGGNVTRKPAEQDSRIVSSTSSIATDSSGLEFLDKKHSGSGGGTFKASRPTIASQAKVHSHQGKSSHRDREEDFEDGLGLNAEEDAELGGLLNKGRLMTVKRTRGAAVTPPISRNGAVTNQGTVSRSRTGDRPSTGRPEGNTGLPAVLVSGRDSPNPTTASIRGTSGLPSSGLATIHGSPPPPGASDMALLGMGTPSRLRHQASTSRLQPGGSTQQASPGFSAGLQKKKSMSALSPGSDPFVAQDRPRTPSLASKHYVAPTASSAARQQAQLRDRSDKERERDKGDSLGRASSGTGSIGYSTGSLGHTSRSDSPNDTTATSRLTLPTTSSKAKARPAIHSVFPSGESRMVSPSRQHAPPAHMLQRPKNARLYGDGTELDAIDDLAVDRAKEGALRRSSDRIQANTETNRTSGAASSSASNAQKSQMAGEKRKKPSSSSSGLASKGKPRKAAGLIRHLGRMEQKKVGDMTWNPQTLRWEGNYGVLRDFDAHTASARPALITQYNSGSTLPASPAGAFPTSGKPIAGVVSSVRVVGDMRFDPVKMCWLSNLQPDEDEPDPFDEMDAEAEGHDGFGDDVEGDGKGGTITKDMARQIVSAGGGRGAGIVEGMKRFASASSVSATSTATSSSSWHDTPHQHRETTQSVYAREGARHRPDRTTSSRTLQSGLPSVSAELLAECREAEARHEEQMTAFHGQDVLDALRSRKANAPQDKKDRDRKDRKEEKRLWEVRNLALRS